jgi:uncharacterized membrane protein YkoI
MQPTTRLTVGLIALAMLGIGATAAAQGAKPAYKHELPAKLARQAKISEDSAAAIAQSKVPGGQIQAVELERENGKLQYSYDIKVPGKSGIEEVNVNAMDGSVLGVEHESPATERKEAAAEKKAKKP